MKFLNRFNILLIFVFIMCMYTLFEFNIDVVFHYIGFKEFKKNLGSLIPFLRKSSSWKKVCNMETKPQRSIIYVKVQKTGSTTLRSTLLIYGKQYKLNICFDSTNLWGLNWPNAVEELKLTKVYNEKCDLIADELIFDPVIVEKLMNKDAFVMASVRHPVEHFLSLYKYSRIQSAVERLILKNVDLWESIRIFFKHYQLVRNIYTTYRENEVRDKYQIDLIQPNLQTRSLGIINGTKAEIIDRLDAFHFVVVADKYDESMVILREKLCCTIQDVVYRKQNVRRSNEEAKVQIPPDIEKAILEFNYADLIFYNIANNRLREEIEKHTYFEQALGIFKHELGLYESKCTNDDVPQTVKDSICPPKEVAQTGIFVENIRAEQQNILLSKLRDKFNST
ncbi:galactose-3-O-sulfotransferase 2 [Hydra vulgaris]|uniref:Galactose-3-O-sulfotransferase 2 n=1 Tax=Hydra vulgaris TaxID=6087 RepID=A0ABM4DJW6_HYDVU